MHLLLSVMCQNWPLFSIPRRGNSETMGAEPKKLGFEQKNWAKKTKICQNRPEKNPDSVWKNPDSFWKIPDSVWKFPE